MKEEGKTVKQYCREAKLRLKRGFWQDYHKELQTEIERAKEQGLSVSKVKDFYNEQIRGNIKNPKEQHDEFYAKVKRILDEEGEISNAIGRLTEREVYASLSYEEQQRYNLELSEKYLKAVERYKKERAILIGN